MREVIPMYMSSKISIAILIELIGNALSVIGFGALVIKYNIIKTIVPGNSYVIPSPSPFLYRIPAIAVAY